MADEHTTSTTTDGSGRVTSKSIQGRALDPSGELAVSERMKSTDLGALARAAAAKKKAAPPESVNNAVEVQKRALRTPDKKSENAGQ